MKFRTKILVHPFGYSYYLGENHIHDEEYFYKTWKIIFSGSSYKAQSIANSEIWDLEFFDDDGKPIDPPPKTCFHRFYKHHISEFPFIDNCGGFTLINKVCGKCHLHESEMLWHKEVKLDEAI